MDGWRGAACEGGTILTLLKAASLPALVRLAQRRPYLADQAESTASSAYFEAQLKEGSAEEVAAEILRATPASVREAFGEIYPLASKHQAMALQEFTQQEIKTLIGFLERIQNNISSDHSS